MQSSRIEALRQANRNLCADLERLRSARNTAATIRAEEFSALRNEVVRAANAMRSASPESAPDADLEKETSEYRKHLRQLSQVLPLVHIGLQARKRRLEAALGHLQAVAAWADASQKSL